MLFKTASAAVLEREIDATAVLNKNSFNWNFEKKPGMLYVAVRAVSVGTNGNGDHFTEEELLKSYQSFIGKGVFVNHASNDIEKKRGRIVDAKWIDAGNEKYVVTALEINAEAFPDMAQMIRSGMADSVSMGCQVAYSNCSVCNHKAKTTKDYCMHIKAHKGGVWGLTPVYEINRDVEFIEVSFVTTGADPMAKVLEVIARKRGMDLGGLLKAAAASNDPYFLDKLVGEPVDMTKMIFNSIRRANDLRGAI